MKPDLLRLRALLGGAELFALRQRLRARYLRAAPAATFSLGPLSSAERQALEGLLGRAASSARTMRVSLDTLDRALARSGIATNLRAALEALDGPFESYAERMQREQRWAELVPRVTEPRLRRLLETPRGLGLLKRLAHDPHAAVAMIAAAQAVLARLPANGVPLAQLAAEAAGDAHALDTGRGLAALVLRAAHGEAEAREEERAQRTVYTTDEARARNRWARLGVSVSELSAPALCLNLEAERDSVGGYLLAAARAAGEPLHLSLGLLLSRPPRWRVADRNVFVCENPTVVAIAAARLGPRCAPMVCTDGMPAAAQRSLLDQLVAAGARLRYHGDFDWAGIRIGNFMMRRFCAAPWRFCAVDYRGRSGSPLLGENVLACWDEVLSSEMQAGAYALHEEAVVDALLEDLAQ